LHIQRVLLVVVLLCASVDPVWAINGARLIGQSASGQTAVFNLGIHDFVKEGEYAVIVKEIRSLDSRDLRIVPVARARNIKVNPGNSVWILYKFYDPELLVKGHQFLILTESAMLQGRRDPRFNRISVITEKEKAALQVQNNLSEDKDRIAKLKSRYPEIQTLHQPENRQDGDGTLVDVEGWKKHKNDRYRTALYKSPYEKDFQRQLKLSTFEKLVTAYVKRVNEPGFNYDAFYDEQMKSDFGNEFRKRSNFSTEYESFLSSQSQKSVADAKLYRSLLEKGESWSEDFSDEELRSVLTQVSVLQEKDRRKFVIANPNRYSAFLTYGMSVNDAQTQQDAGYRRDGRYSIELEFEVIPVLKHETLERFSLTASYRNNKTAFEASDFNSSLDENSFSLGINWYPLYAPYTIEAPVIFLGAYMRSGWAHAEAPSANEKSNYTLLTLPGVRVGMKYNFKNNFGLRLSASMETLQLDRYEQSEFGANLPDQASIADGKMNFAMVYSF